MIHILIGHFLQFGPSDQLDIAYCDPTKWSSQFRCDVAHAGSFKSHENAFLNDPKCQKGFFLDLGLLDRLDIAYDDRTKCVITFNNANRA